MTVRALKGCDSRRLPVRTVVLIPQLGLAAPVVVGGAGGAR